MLNHVSGRRIEKTLVWWFPQNLAGCEGGEKGRLRGGLADEMGMPGTKRGDSGGSRLVGNNKAESLCRIRCKVHFAKHGRKDVLTKQVPPSGLWEFTLLVPERTCSRVCLGFPSISGPLF